MDKTYENLVSVVMRVVNDLTCLTHQERRVKIEEAFATVDRTMMLEEFVSWFGGELGGESSSDEFDPPYNEDDEEADGE